VRSHIKADEENTRSDVLVIRVDRSLQLVLDRVLDILTIFLSRLFNFLGSDLEYVEELTVWFEVLFNQGLL
jgi:uncharacterized protein YutE (UPF0331/DUF86 family)